MKIIQIISGDLWAGAEVMYYMLLKGLKLHKEIQLSAILLNEGKLAYEIRNIGIDVIIVDESKLNIFQIINKIKIIVDGLSPDIIHSHRMKENILSYLSHNSRGKKIPLIATQHGMPEPIPSNKYLKNMVATKYNMHILMKHFKYVVAVSEDIRIKFIQKYGIPSDKIVVINNGINVSTSCSKKTENDIFVIGSAGRLFPIKNYEFMVEIAKEIIRKSSKVRFELAGEGPEREKIVRRIRECNIEDAFILRGFIEDMESFYSNLDIYINTSLHEGFPMSILEAMAFGLPIIAPNIGGIKEMMDNGQQGYIIEGRNPSIYADKCLEIIGDKQLYYNMSRASKEKIFKKYSTEIMANKYCNLYKNILGTQ